MYHTVVTAIVLESVMLPQKMQFVPSLVAVFVAVVGTDKSVERAL